MIIWITVIRMVVCALCMLMTAAEEEWSLVLDTMHFSMVHSREPKFLSALSKVKRPCITEREKIKRKVALFKMGNCQ